VDHLPFECPVAKVVWGIIAMCFRQKDRPNSYEHFCPWVYKALLEEKSSICWTGSNMLGYLEGEIKHALTKSS
jgi:hypothetical protein